MCHWTAELESWITGQAQLAGFDAAGIAPLDAPSSGAAQTQSAHYADWIAKGHAGEMEYLKRSDENGVLLRSAVQVALPWARSVVVCAVNYNADAPLSLEPTPSGTGWIARYAWSGSPHPEGHLQPTDYHQELLSRLRTLEAAILSKLSCQTRCYVDTGPIIERSLAAKAGIGWIGKNTCVLNQRLGSWLLLGVIITSIKAAENRPSIPAADRCGSCTRCIDACPTSALIARREMDASRCISYLTIEKKGSIPEELREPMGRNIFGCDICQDVCPWNRRAPTAFSPGMQTRQELVNPALEWLAEMDGPGFNRWFAGSPLERTGRKRLHRNIAIAMGNSGQTRFLARLRAWAAGDDPILAETASWSIQRILRSSADPSANPSHSL